MSLSERNRFLQILHKNGCKREYVPRIMDDLQFLFDGGDTDPVEDEIDFLAARADIELSPGDRKKRVMAWRELLVTEQIFRQRQQEEAQRQTEERIRGIQRELVIKGIVSEKDQEDRSEEQIEHQIAHQTSDYKITQGTSTLRYGRSPLHQAIISGEICLAEEYIKDGKFLTDRDNNGNTAQELARLMGCNEIFALFGKYPQPEEVEKK